MSFQRIDADTAETLAGVVRLLRRAAELVWAAADAERAGSPRRVLGVGHRPGRRRGTEPASGRDPGRRAGPHRG